MAANGKYVTAVVHVKVAAGQGSAVQTTAMSLLVVGDLLLSLHAEAANINIPAIGSDWSSEDWLQVQPKAVCRDHHTGFLCAECKTNYKAIEGECILCDKTDWHCEAFAGCC